MRLIMYNNALVSFSAQIYVCSIHLDRDCMHHKLAAHHPLSQHILYRLTADEYLQAEK